MGRAGSLFTGALGLDRAAAQVFNCDLAWACDNDPAAAKVIEYRAGVPNLGDITRVGLIYSDDEWAAMKTRAAVGDDWTMPEPDWSVVEPVELLTAGWPCQPWSTAGKQKGVEDERALWPEVARAIRALRPAVVVLENVPAIVAAGELARACADLAACGYRFCWVVLGADEVGAPHRRNRCFILAVADTAGPRRPGHLAGAALAGDGGTESAAGQVQPGGHDRAAGDAAMLRRDPAQPAHGRHEPARSTGGPDSDAADTDRAGLEGREPAAGRDMPAGGTPVDAGRGGRRPGELDLRAGQPDAAGGCVDWGIYTAAIERWEQIVGRPAPVPRVDGPRGGLKLNPALCEWMQGFPAGWITDVPGVSLNDCLKLAGNSVNPYQAVAALRWMAAQLLEAA